MGESVEEKKIINNNESMIQWFIEIRAVWYVFTFIFRTSSKLKFMKNAIRCNPKIERIRRSGLNSSKRFKRSLHSIGNVTLSTGGNTVKPSVLRKLESLHLPPMFDIVWLFGMELTELIVLLRWSSITSKPTMDMDLFLFGDSSGNTISGYWKRKTKNNNQIQLEFFPIGILKMS